MSGYSGRPLHRKLGLKDGMRVQVLNTPSDYRRLVGPDAPAFELLDGPENDLDMVHLFTDARGELQAIVPDAVTKIRPAGMIWISWPKKSSGVETDVTEDVLREVCLPLGLVDVKVCAVDSTWSALRFVIRKENRQ